jgi:hypothetical protein
VLRYFQLVQRGSLLPWPSPWVIDTESGDGWHLHCPQRLIHWDRDGHFADRCVSRGDWVELKYRQLLLFGGFEDDTQTLCRNRRRSTRE